MAKERLKAKREQERAGRAVIERRQQRSAIVWKGVAAVVVVGGIGWVAYSTITDRNLAAVVTTANYPPGQHVAGPISYKEDPPIGGTHNVVWQNCGIYTAPIHNEHGVHALEHGAVWITYRPTLAADELQRLKTLASDDFMLLSPYPGLSAPIVASAWNHQIRLERADDSLLRQFIAEYKNNPATTPEFGAPCAGGTSVTAEADSLNGSGQMAR